MTQTITTETPTGTTTLARVTLWVTLALVLLADALDLIDSTVTNIAAPTIAHDLGGGAGLIKWLGASYTLALGALLVVGGRLGDRFGQRRLFLVGIAGFTLASLACGLAPNPALLLTARAVQGGFGAFLIPQGMAIMVRAFPRDALRTAFALFGPLLGLASVGGPVLAGFLISADLFGLGWRPIFLINVVLGVIGFLVAIFVLPAVPADRTVRLDAAGSVLLIAGVFCLMLGLVDGSGSGWTLKPALVAAVGLAALALFVLRQRTAENPLLKMTLFRNRGFSFGLVVGLVFFAVTTGLSYVISLFMQQQLGVDAKGTAIALLPLVGGIIAASFAGMGLLEKLGRRLLLAGFALTVAGGAWLLLLVASLGTSVSLWALAPAVFVLGLGMGAGFSSIFNIALGDIAEDETGSASGSLEAVQQLAGGAGSALVASLYIGMTGVSAMTATLIVVLGLTVICAPLVGLLPKKAFVEEH